MDRDAEIAEAMRDQAVAEAEWRWRGHFGTTSPTLALAVLDRAMRARDEAQA